MADQQARTVILKDIAASSIFFFLDPQYDSLESQTMLRPVKLDRYGESHPPTIVPSSFGRKCAVD